MDDTKTQIAINRSRLDQLRLDVDGLEQVMFGTGAHDAGIKTRVDRLEQKSLGHSNAVVIAGSVIAALIAAAAQVVAAILRH